MDRAALPPLELHHQEVRFRRFEFSGERRQPHGGQPDGDRPVKVTRDVIGKTAHRAARHIDLVDDQLRS